MKLIIRILNGMKYRCLWVYGKLQRIHSRICVFLSGKQVKSKSILLSLKNKYNGKRCFILGNGPSLTVNDLELLKDEITFASNRIFNIFTQTTWRPTFYSIGDRTVAISDDVQSQLDSINCEMKFFIREHYIQASYKKLTSPHCFVKDVGKMSNFEYKPYFATDLTKGVCMLGTVTFMLMQLAVWMGFTEIYLLGCDNKYQFEISKDGKIIENKGVKSYFGNNQQKSGAYGRTWETNLVYEFAEKYSREHNFRIYNATRGGYLETFERKNLDEVLASNGDNND